MQKGYEINKYKLAVKLGELCLGKIKNLKGIIKKRNNMFTYLGGICGVLLFATL